MKDTIGKVSLVGLWILLPILHFTRYRQPWYWWAGLIVVTLIVWLAPRR